MNTKYIALIGTDQRSLFSLVRPQVRSRRNRLVARLIASGLVALAVLACAVAPARAETFQVLEDTYSASGMISKSAGTAATLLVGPKNAAFIKFGVTNAGLTAAQVCGARLTLYFPAVTAAGTLDIFANSSDFSEILTKSVAASTQNPTNLGSVDVTPADRQTFVVIDVTAQVQGWLAGSTPDYGFAIMTTNGAKVTIAAKEGPATGYPAVLEVDTTPSSVVGTNATLSGNVTAASFSGNGGGLTSLNASQLTSGTVPFAQLPAGLVTNTETGVTFGGAFTGSLTGNASTASTAANASIAESVTGLLTNSITGNAASASTATHVVSGVAITNAFLTNATITNSSFAGNGGGLTNLNVAQLNGPISVGQLPAAVLTSNETSVTLNNLILTGKLTLPNNNSNTVSGYQSLYTNTTGYANTAYGYQALFANKTGTSNTATGFATLIANTTGNFNTANGSVALYSNTTGNNNTAIGSVALNGNTTGSCNTANGSLALAANTTGSFNTANGSVALTANTTGPYNTASGAQALDNNTTGGGNTATGALTLAANLTGGYNTAAGFQALRSDTNGGYNTATGAEALEENMTGPDNTAIGAQALRNNKFGANNIALGYQAASAFTNSESSNIDIGNIGVAGESGITRIGTPGVQTNAYIAGVINGNGAGLTNLQTETISGNQTVALAMSTYYFPWFGAADSTTESAVEYNINRGGILTNFMVTCNGLGAGTNVVWAVLTNGVPTSITCTVNGNGGGATFATDTTDSVFATDYAVVTLQAVTANANVASQTWAWRFNIVH